MLRIITLFVFFPLYSFSQQIGIGQWRDHLSFYNVSAVDHGNDQVFGASDQGIIQFDLRDNSLSKYTRVNGLNDFSISAIRYDADRSSLIVGYINGNIDILKSGVIKNMPDIKRSTFVGDKSISNIHISGKTAYFACGFGIVAYDLNKSEIMDTYKFGPNGAAIKVNDIAVHQGRIFAATNQGIYSADQSNQFLSNFENWTKESGFAQANGEFTEIETYRNRIFVSYHPNSGNDLILEKNTSWNPLSSAPSAKYLSIRGTEDRLIFSTANTLFVIIGDNSSGETISKPFASGNEFAPRDASFFRNNYYIAEENQGLLYTSNGTEYFQATPNGPLTNNVSKLFSSGGYVYIATGSVDPAYVNGFKQHGIPYFDGSVWKTVDENSDDSLRNKYDFLGVNIDPNNPAHAYVASWGGGLIDLNNGKVTQVYNKFNSAIQEFPLLPGNYRIASSVFDPEGNLWVGNSVANNNVVVRTPGGAWYSYKMDPSFGNASLTTVSQILVAQDGTKWMVRNRNGLYAFSDNGTLTSTGDDKYRSLTIEANNGGLPSNDVFCIVEDLDGEIWMGTDKGFAILYSPSSAISGSAINADQPIIEQDGNFEKILETEVINSIAVDGGNRKWMATQSSGVYLLSDDGTEQVLHFTTENSPLLSDEVFSVTIDQLSGEVYFGTSLGVQSYLSDATGPSEEIASVKVFPNPVKPNYDGPIAIRGLVRDTDVKVADIAGNVVFKTKSQGGQAIWDGRNFRGEKCATGVYLVFCTNSDGEETGVGKILFVR